jgi:hypothetical protein
MPRARSESHLGEGTGVDPRGLCSCDRVTQRVPEPRCRGELLDPEQEEGEPSEPELPPEEEPVTAPEPETLPEEPDLTLPA